jgi:hypothetical protein
MVQRARFRCSSLASVSRLAVDTLAWMGLRTLLGPSRAEPVCFRFDATGSRLGFRVPPVQGFYG